jgi:hypothetical protein
MEGDAFHWVFWAAKWDVDINMGGTRDVDGMVGRWSVTDSEELIISSLGEVIFQSTRAWGSFHFVFQQYSSTPAINLGIPSSRDIHSSRSQ